MSKSVSNGFFNVEDQNKFIYSVDMLRLKARISNDFFMKNIHKAIQFDSYIESWESTKLTDFKYNYKVNVSEEFSYWFGFQSNKELYCGDGNKKRFNF